jgi:hypothetical protein
MPIARDFAKQLLGKLTEEGILTAEEAAAVFKDFN